MQTATPTLRDVVAAQSARRHQVTLKVKFARQIALAERKLENLIETLAGKPGFNTRLTGDQLRTMHAMPLRASGVELVAAWVECAVSQGNLDDLLRKVEGEGWSFATAYELPAYFSGSGREKGAQILPPSNGHMGPGKPLYVLGSYWPDGGTIQVQDNWHGGDWADPVHLPLQARGSFELDLLLLRPA